MDEMKKIRLVKRIFEAYSVHDLGRWVALQAKDYRFVAPGISGGVKRSMKTNLLHIISISILATIVLTPGQGLGVGAARQAKHPDEPTGPALGTTTRVSVSSDGDQGNDMSGYWGISISADGRYVAYLSLASNLVSGDTNGLEDIFVHDQQTGSTKRVSVASDDSQGNGLSHDPSISADGRYVAFGSSSDNLVSGDTNGFGDVFVHDRQTGTTERISVASDGSQGNGWSSRPTLSSDGRYVGFESDAANLVGGDTNGIWDVFVHDRQTGNTERVSVASDGSQGNSYSQNSSISADGHYVAFESWASNLVEGDTNEDGDIFVHDRQTRSTKRASVSSEGIEGNNDSSDPSISADGRYVAFDSSASTLVGEKHGGVFVHDQNTGITDIISLASDGSEEDDGSSNPSISVDGRYVAFLSSSTNLVDGDTNGVRDSFVRDRQSGSTERVSLASDGSQGNNLSGEPSISADGRYVAFDSFASNLVSDDTNNFCMTWDGYFYNCPDVFVRDRAGRYFVFYLPVTQNYP